MPLPQQQQAYRGAQHHLVLASLLAQVVFVLEGPAFKSAGDARGETGKSVLYQVNGLSHRSRHHGDGSATGDNSGVLVDVASRLQISVSHFTCFRKESRSVVALYQLNSMANNLPTHQGLHCRRRSMEGECIFPSEGTSTSWLSLAESRF